MASSPLSRLPAELLQTIFAQLPVSSLLAFAQTSKSNYVLATSVLSYLELAIFPKSIHSVLAFLEEECREDVDDDDDNDDNTLVVDWLNSRPRKRRPKHHMTCRRPNTNPELYQISRATQTNHSRPPSPTALIAGNDRMTARRSTSPTKASPKSLRVAEFTAQNNLATTILSSRSIRFNIRSLTLHLYTLHTTSLASVLSSLSSLQHLNLNFAHAYINDTTLPASYWRTTPAQGSGSPIWNALAGVGPEASSALKLRNLRTLTLRRAGITACQLRSWIASNPHLREIVLDKVRGVELEFVDWLADYISDQHDRIDVEEGIDSVVLNDCSELSCTKIEDFGWINRLAEPKSTPQPTLTTLSIRGCKNVDDTLFCSLAGLVESPGRSSHSSLMDARMEMDIDPISFGSSSFSDEPAQTWSQAIYRLVSPKGTMIKNGQRVLTNREKQKMGTRSPTLTIHDALTASSNIPGSGASHRKRSRQEQMIEVDPDLL